MSLMTNLIKAARKESVKRKRNAKFLDCNISKTFKGERIDKPGSEIELRCYLGILIGNPTQNFKDKVYGFVEIDRNYRKFGHKLTPTLEEQVIPYLIGKNLF